MDVVRNEGSGRHSCQSTSALHSEACIGEPSPGREFGSMSHTSEFENKVSTSIRSAIEPWLGTVLSSSMLSHRAFSGAKCPFSPFWILAVSYAVFP